MAYKPKGSDGRITGTHILISGEYIPLIVFSQNLGYDNWSDYIAYNPPTAGVVPLRNKRDALNGEIPLMADKVEQTSDIAETVETIRSAASPRAGEIGAKIDGYSPLTYENLPRLANAGLRLPEPQVPGGYDRSVGPVGPARDYKPDPNSRMEDMPKIINDGGNMEDMPRIIPDNSGGGYKLFQGSVSGQSNIRSLYVNQSSRDALAGGNVTDIYRSYLGGD